MGKSPAVKGRKEQSPRPVKNENNVKTPIAMKNGEKGKKSIPSTSGKNLKNDKTPVVTNGNKFNNLGEAENTTKGRERMKIKKKKVSVAAVESDIEDEECPQLTEGTITNAPDSPEGVTMNSDSEGDLVQTVGDNLKETSDVEDVIEEEEEEEITKTFSDLVQLNISLI